MSEAVAVEEVLQPAIPSEVEKPKGSDLQKKRAAAMKLKEERKVKFAEQKAINDAKRLKEAKERFEKQRKEEEAREKAELEARLLKEKEAAALSARREAERLQILEGIRVREEELAKKKAMEEFDKIKLAKKAERARLLEQQLREKEAKEKAEAERIGKLWVEVYNSRAFKHASPGAKSLISKENPDGLLDRLKDIRFLNGLELASRKV